MKMFDLKRTPYDHCKGARDLMGGGKCREREKRRDESRSGKQEEITKRCRSPQFQRVGRPDDKSS